MSQGAVSLPQRGGGVICHSTTSTEVYLKDSIGLYAEEEERKIKIFLNAINKEIMIQILSNGNKFILK